MTAPMVSLRLRLRSTGAARWRYHGAMRHASATEASA
jgi:hypothetical protein